MKASLANASWPNVWSPAGLCHTHLFPRANFNLYPFPVINHNCETLNFGKDCPADLAITGAVKNIS